MPEICLAEYPDKKSPIAFQIAATLGEKTPLVNPLYATFIHRMLGRSSIKDVQADILADLYGSGIVRRDNIPHLRDTLTALEPADVLASAIQRAHKENRLARRIVDIMSRIQEQTDLQHVLLLNKDGLYAETITANGELPLYLDDDFVDTFGEDSYTEKVARQLKLNAYVFSKELVWRPGQDGQLQAVLLSDLDHHALGRMDYAGNFEHVVTVLSPEHPIRREGIPIDY